MPAIESIARLKISTSRSEATPQMRTTSAAVMRVMRTYPGTSPRSPRGAFLRKSFFMTVSFLHGVKSRAMSPG